MMQLDIVLQDPRIENKTIRPSGCISLDLPKIKTQLVYSGKAGGSQ